MRNASLLATVVIVCVGLLCPIAHSSEADKPPWFVDTASSLIEQNLFNWNRHSIAGTGRPGSSYVARHNVELGESLSHCFDMHGGRDRKDGTDIAGTTIEIYNNTFRAQQTPVVIRGVPQEKCEVHHNWFLRHSDDREAVRSSGNTKVFSNAYTDGAKRSAS